MKNKEKANAVMSFLRRNKKQIIIGSLVLVGTAILQSLRSTDEEHDRSDEFYGKFDDGNVIDDGAYNVTESEFDELIHNRDDTIFIEYDRTTGILRETPSGIVLDSGDEESIGKTLINSFIDGDDDIMWARNERLDANYEFTRFESEK